MARDGGGGGARDQEAEPVTQDAQAGRAAGGREQVAAAVDAAGRPGTGTTTGGVGRDDRALPLSSVATQKPVVGQETASMYADHVSVD